MQQFSSRLLILLPATLTTSPTIDRSLQTTHSVINTIQTHNFGFHTGEFYNE